MSQLTRREFLAASAGGGVLLAGPMRAVAEAVGPVRITGVDSFSVQVPIPEESQAAGQMNSYVVARIDTDVGVRGYSFAGPSPSRLDSHIRPALVGKDLFALERHLRAGLIQWGGLEHAVWDTIGKLAGQPVHRLFGSAKRSVRVYLTCVWHGNLDQSHVSYDEQAAMAVRIKEAGFKGMKIRAWRPNPLDDVLACREIRAAVGPDFAIMFDRTARAPEQVGQKVWNYETARRVARALEKHGTYWLEEPFARDDYASPARLAREVEIPITGGEGFQGLQQFSQCVKHGSFDILQPEGAGSGGILVCHKVAALAEAFGCGCVLHGTMGLRLAGWLQASAAVGAPWQELALIRPPLLPEQQWAPGLKLLNHQRFCSFRDGEIQLPELPGIGLDVDEDAVERFRQG